MTEERANLLAVLRDTTREAVRSWRLPVALVVGTLFGLLERAHTRHSLSLAFGPLVALYALLLGPLPWRVLVPLEADGDRARKFVRGALASVIALAMFAVAVLPYAIVARALDLDATYVVTHPRELAVSTLLFLITGWGLARDVQLEQRLDRSLRRHGQLASELEEARLHALRADLDPHFLFNALNAIASQCASDPRQAEDNVVRLSSLLRAVLDTRRRPLHPLDEEVSLARDYLGLLSARYPALQHAIDVDTALGTVGVPPLLLQPLLENAVRHGAIDRGPIVLEGRLYDPPCPLDGALVHAALTVRSLGPFGGARDGGMGIELVRRRVELAWGPRARFHIGPDESDPQGATLARIELLFDPRTPRSPSSRPPQH